MNTVYCENEDHFYETGKRRKAVARLEWPSGRFRPTTACRSDLRWSVSEALANNWPLLITPIGDER